LNPARRAPGALISWASHQRAGELEAERGAVEQAGGLAPRLPYPEL